MADRLVRLAGLLGAHQHAVVDAGHLARFGAPRRHDADFRRGAVRLFVPFGRHGDQFAVRVAARDVGHDDRRQVAATVELLALALDLAAVGEIAQQTFQLGISRLEAERARDLALADLPGTRGDEREYVRLGGEGRTFCCAV